MSGCCVEIKNLTKRFAETGTVAVDNLTLNIPAGQTVGLIGADAAGKTTLLRLISGLLLPDSGTIRTLGLNPVTQKTELNAGIGYMPQKFGLYEDLTIRANLDFYADLKNVEHKFDRMLEFAGLTPFQERLAGRLSGGMKQKLGTFEQLIVSPYTATDILIAKTVPPLFIVLVMTLVTTGLASLCFNIPFAGSFLLFLLSCFIALLSFVGVGLFISSVTRNQQQAILGAFAFMMPAILLSGFISPVDDMPQILQYLTYLNPVRFFLTFARGIFLKDMPFDDVLMHLVPLVLIAAGTLTLAARTFKKNLE